MSKVSKKTTLDQLITNYDRDRELAKCYISTLRSSVRRLDKFLGRPSKVGDLKYKTINRWLQYECDEGRLAPKRLFKK